MHDFFLAVAIVTAIGGWIAAGLTAVGVAATVAGTLGTILAAGLVIGATLLISRSFQKKTQEIPDIAKPEAQQQTIRQAVAPRTRHYGRVKVGGVLSFYESKDGILHTLVTTGHGEIDAIEQFWLNDKLVAVNGSGEVQTGEFRLGSTASGASFVDGTGSTLITLLTKNGTANQTAHADLVAAFPGIITNDFRQRGCSNIYARFKDTPAESFSKHYSGGAPNVTVVLRGAKVYDPRTNQNINDPATWGWSDNPALIMLDFLTHADGYRFASSAINIAAFAAEANVCDEPVLLKSGNSEKRYRCWGSYSLQEEPKDVLARMMEACDGEIYADNEGKIALRVGKWVAPTVTIQDQDVIAISVSGGNNMLAASNVVKFTYVSQAHNFQMQEGDPWRDEANITLRQQVLETSIEMHMVPSFAQARRLAKIHCLKTNPAKSGSLTLNLNGLKLLDQRVAILNVVEAGILNQPVLIDGITINEGFTAIELKYTTIEPTLYNWVAATEEGEPPLIVTDWATAPVIEPPTGVLVSVSILANASSLPVLNISWDVPTRDSVSHRVNWKLTTDTVWQEALVPSGIIAFQTGLVNDGLTYEVRVAAVAPLGQQSAWSPVPSATINVSSNPTPPAPVQSGSATGGTAKINWAWQNPNSANFNHVKLMVNTVNNYATASQAAIVYGSPNQSQTFEDLGVSAGTYYGWVVSVSASNINGAAIATSLITVT